MNRSFFKTTATTRGSSLPKLLLGLFLLLTLSLALQACGGGDEEENQPQPKPVTVAPTSAPTPKPPPTVGGEEAQQQPTPVTVAPTPEPTPKPSPVVDWEKAQPQPTSITVTSVPSPCPAEGVGSSMSDNAGRVDLDVLQLARNNSNFAFDLYSALSDGEDNLFFSPFSISQVLAMAYIGARGETERQMADTLRYSLPQDRLHPAYSSLDLALHARGEDAYNPFESEEDNPNFRLNIANAV